jgi:hypothetical protein
MTVKYHALTISSLADLLDERGEQPVPNFELDSYRGYYEQLGLEIEPGTQSAVDAAKQLRRAINREFQGYKGGDYTMTESTPVWIHNYGTTSGSGQIIGVTTDAPGEFIIVQESWMVAR